MDLVSSHKSLRSKRTSPAEPSDPSSEDCVPTCYLTRGSQPNDWHVWNTCSSALSLRAGSPVRAYLVGADFEHSIRRRAYVLRDLIVHGAASLLCETPRDMRFKEPDSFDPDSVASQTELTNACAGKGIECALFLEHYAKEPRDRELLLGCRMNALFVHTVREMLGRKYDIMHHYPLFNRAMSLYYSDKLTIEPPELKDVIAPGGLLDRSAEQHQALHGIAVTGEDHVGFSRWKYPDEEEDDEEDEERRHGDSSVPEREDSGGPRGVCQGKDRHESRRKAKARQENFVLPDQAMTNTFPERRGVSREEEHYAAFHGTAADGGVAAAAAAVDDDDDGTRAFENALEIQHAKRVGGAPYANEPEGYAHSEAWREIAVRHFNNHPGALTDRAVAFPYSFTVHVGQGVSFDDLIDYCVSRTAKPVSGLPPRREWGAVNPVLLMEDPVDPTTGKRVHRYTVTSRGRLSDAGRRSNAKPCYNEVFLPGRPVSRLNLDLDLKCCEQCNARFAARADDGTKRKVAEAMATSLMFVIVESLLALADVKRGDLTDGPRVRDLVRSTGKIAAYVRPSAKKSKLSLRMLWYLPVELCDARGIEAYKPLLEEMERVSLDYVLLSYPSGTNSCGLCELGTSMTRNSHSSRCLRVDSAQANDRRSAIDGAPYSFRKCVRLPNCYKEDSRFEYVDTFNRGGGGGGGGFDDSGFDEPRSLSAGLSSNPLSHDVTSLGSRFRGVLRARRDSKPSGQPVALRLEGEPAESRVRSEADRLTGLWGVPVTVSKTGSGLFCVRALEKSTTYPCPIHNRVHSTCKLGAVVFATVTKPKCFVP